MRTRGSFYLRLWPPERATLYAVMAACRKMLPGWIPGWMEWCEAPRFISHVHPHMGTASFHRFPPKNPAPRWLRRWWPVCEWEEGGRFWKIFHQHRWYCPGRIWALYGGIRGSLIELTWKICDWRYLEINSYRSGGLPPHRRPPFVGHGRPDRNTIYVLRPRKNEEH